MVKYKVANAGSILHIPGEIEEKWKTKRSVKTFTLMSKAPMGDSHSQTFYNYLRYQQYPEGASKLESPWCCEQEPCKAPVCTCVLCLSAA